MGPGDGASSWHGVTTAIMGNCSIGFAPVSPDRHTWLIGQMEGVEDLPAPVLEAGIDWRWETFPEYLDALDRMPRTIDIVTQVPHGAVRAYVMGERGERNDPATPEDIAAMADLVEEGMRAGAVGFSTSRTRAVRSSDGECIPGTFATPEEVMALGQGMARSGHGVFQVSSELGTGGFNGDFAEDADWMIQFARETGLPLLYLLFESGAAPGEWRELPNRMAKVREEYGGAAVRLGAGPPPGSAHGLGRVDASVQDAPDLHEARSPPAASTRRRASQARGQGADLE